MDVIMQGLTAYCSDRRKSERTSVLLGGGFDNCGHFVFLHADLQRLHCGRVHLGGHVAGAIDLGDFFRTLVVSHLNDGSDERHGRSFRTGLHI